MERDRVNVRDSVPCDRYVNFLWASLSPLPSCCSVFGINLLITLNACWNNFIIFVFIHIGWCIHVVHTLTLSLSLCLLFMECQISSCSISLLPLLLSLLLLGAVCSFFRFFASVVKLHEKTIKKAANDFQCLALLYIIRLVGQNENRQLV